MSMTEAQLHHKRMGKAAVRAQKAEGRRRQWTVKRNTQRNTRSWMGRIGAQQERAQQAQEQALESRRSKAAIAGHGKKGLLSRIKSFFGRER